MTKTAWKLSWPPLPMSARLSALVWRSVFRRMALGWRDRMLATA